MTLKSAYLNKTKMAYFEQEDILHLEITDEPERGSIELNPNITVELNDNGELIGIEILNASAFIRELKTIQFWNLYKQRYFRLTKFTPLDYTNGQI